MPEEKVEPTIDTQIQEFNKGIDDAEDGVADNADESTDTEGDKTTDTKADTKTADSPISDTDTKDAVDTKDDKTKSKKEDEPDKTDDPGESTTTEDGDTGADPFKFTENADWDTFVTERAAYLETVEITPELQTVMDRQDEEIQTARTNLAEIDALGSRELIIKTINAIGQLAETEFVDGEVVPKTKPVVDFLQQNFKKEFSPLAIEILAARSLKYKGATVFEEALIDQYGAKPEQIAAMTKYLESGADLPIPPPGVRLPASVHESLKEAWYKLPEIKRFEVEGLTKEIGDLEKELNDPDTSDYDKEQIKQTIGEKRGKLEVEIDLIKDKQGGINNQRAQEEQRKQQDASAVSEFVGQVVTAYNTDILGMAEAAATDLAPRLTYLDSDSQLGEARDKLARVFSALGFRYDEEGNVIEDPIADHYAKQLKEEGIQYDFVKGRGLLQDHFQATWKLQHLKATGGSEMAVDRAEKALKKLVLDIKTEQKELLGQIAEKRVKSSNTALGKKIEAVKDKKQAVRSRIEGTPATDQKRGSSPKDIDKDIKEWNRQVEQQEGYADDDLLFDRKPRQKAA